MWEDLKVAAIILLVWCAALGGFGLGLVVYLDRTIGIEPLAFEKPPNRLD